MAFKERDVDLDNFVLREGEGLDELAGDDVADVLQDLVVVLEHLPAEGDQVLLTL